MCACSRSCWGGTTYANGSMTRGTKDVQTVTSGGEKIEVVPVGVTFRDLQTHVDDRGWVCELFNPAWGWHSDPLAHAYVFTVRPGVAKGWGRHDHTEDRYAILSGEAEVVMYDARPDSSTHGLVSVVTLSEFRRRLMNMPTGIWHAVRNVGTSDVVIVNFKTKAFDPENPDKFRLPLDTEEIPYQFPAGTRGG